jgi:hypothetical protein
MLIILVANFTSAGRAGESALLTWKNCFWSFTLNCIVFIYIEEKTGKKYPLTYYNDCQHWQLCYIDALASFIVLKGGIPINSI